MLTGIDDRRDESGPCTEARLARRIHGPPRTQRGRGRRDKTLTVGGIEHQLPTRSDTAQRQFSSTTRFIARRQRTGLLRTEGIGRRSKPTIRREQFEGSARVD